MKFEEVLVYTPIFDYIERAVIIDDEYILIGTLEQIKRMTFNSDLYKIFTKKYRREQGIYLVHSRLAKSYFGVV